VGGTALLKAVDKVVDKGKKIAAHLLETAEEDIEFSGGKFGVGGTDRSVPFAQVAFAAYVPHNIPIETLEPGLDETASPLNNGINHVYAEVCGQAQARAAIKRAKNGDQARA
jgi:CO/xanthine dehydrogenase Mo-binding subunit